METKLRSSEWDSVKWKVKMPNVLLVDARGRKGGLGLLWPRDVSVEILSFSTHHIEACIKDGTNQPWRLVRFYGHHKVASRKQSWNLMRLLNGLSTLPTIFIGKCPSSIFESFGPSSNLIDTGDASGFQKEQQENIQIEESWCLFEETLQDDEGRWHRTMEGISKVAIDFYVKLFGSQSRGNMFLLGQLHTTQLDPQNVQSLDVEFTKEEVKMPFCYGRLKVSGT
ncbi:hypothetical protein LIER_12041 [Lithospermum erythrorhizon]|uniref:Uncharacterized protein n=1 Tax=Lithospermum erythrorhizon TaxID=34254 RepID=A0AAV3PRQ4_LITER